VFHRVTREVVAYAESVENPVLVLEDLRYIRETMDYGEYMNRRLHGWGFAKLHAQIRYKAAERGIPVETVNPRKRRRHVTPAVNTDIGHDRRRSAARTRAVGSVSTRPT
jgi:IS605 OrfB family transposase